MHILSIIKNGKWSPGIGDPTLIGWLIVAAYITAALLCAWRAYSAGKNRLTRPLAFLLTLTVVLTLLAVNKQLDLQTWLTGIARNMARERGWYQQRYIFQRSVVITIAAAGGCLIILTAWFMRHCRRHRLALIGLILLLTFILIRSASFHSIDDVMAFKCAGLKLKDILELGAIACIAISAARCKQQTATSNQLKK